MFDSFFLWLIILVLFLFSLFGIIPVSNHPPLWNSNSQRVADYLIKWGWNDQIGMLHDVNEPGCRDYVGSNSCDNTYWTTSDNIPTCWTLGNYGFTRIMNKCKNTVTGLGAFTMPNDGERYEIYTGLYPIVIGNPGDMHTILLPPKGINRVVCTSTPCPNHPYGFLNNQTYNIQSDAWNDGGKGTPNPNGCVDTVAPQSINYWIRGDLEDGSILAKNLVSRWDGHGVDYQQCGNQAYSSWQLGQVMFVMRVYSYDQNNSYISTKAGSMPMKQIFNSMVNELWSIQNSNGWLPNGYTPLGPLSGHDPENQDAGLLPFSYSVISFVQDRFGYYNMTSQPN